MAQSRIIRSEIIEFFPYVFDSGVWPIELLANGAERRSRDIRASSAESLKQIELFLEARLDPRLRALSLEVCERLLKLADFGLGGVAVRRAVQQSRIGTTTIDYLSLAEQASLFRGAGTPLYMSPELNKKISPALKKRMQGKACFNFKTEPDSGMLEELASLTEAGFQQFRAQLLV